MAIDNHQEIKIGTQAEVEKLMEWWKVSEPMPKKGYATIISLPKYYSPNTIRITVSKYESIWGERLYRIEFLSVIDGEIPQWSQEN